MPAVKPQETVFLTGPDDSLRVIDVQGEGEVLGAFEAASQAEYKLASSDDFKLTPSQKAMLEDEKTQAVQKLKEQASSGELLLTNDKLTSLNVSDSVVEGFIGGTAPVGVSKADLARELPELSSAETTAAMASVRNTSSPSSYRAKTQAELTRNIKATKKVTESARSGKIKADEELKSIGMTRDNTALEITERSNTIGPDNPWAVRLAKLVSILSPVDEIFNDGKGGEILDVADVITDSGLSDRDKQFVSGERLSTTAENSNLDGVIKYGELITGVNQNGKKKASSRSLLKNYRRNRANSKTTPLDDGQLLLETINTVSPDTIKTVTGENTMFNASVLRYGSNDALSVLGRTEGMSGVASYLKTKNKTPRTTAVAIGETLALFS